MKKSLILLALLGMFTQSAYAVCPTACAPKQACKKPISCAKSCLEKVKIPKKHWWSRKRTGYRTVFTGQAKDCCTGCAIPVQSKGLVLIPKKWFWESDEYRQMP